MGNDVGRITGNTEVSLRLGRNVHIADNPDTIHRKRGYQDSSHQSYPICPESTSAAWIEQLVHRGCSPLE
jgi:hypothetical protein